MVNLQWVQCGLLSSYSRPQFLHFMESFMIDWIKTKVIRKLSTNMINYLQRLFSSRGENMKKKYEQCTRSNNPKDLDTYIINDSTGLETLVKCVVADREKKTKQKKVRY